MNAAVAPKNEQRGELVVGAVLAILGVILTVLLKILDGLLSGAISIASVARIPNLGDFLYDEYFLIGLDLVVVAFSFTIGAAISFWSEPKRVKALLLPTTVMVLTCVGTLFLKGLSDQAVHNYEGQILNSASAKHARVPTSLIDRYVAIQDKCKQPAAGFDDLCRNYRVSKQWQIKSPILLALITLALSVWGATRKPK